jgi:hypothetical protein
LKKAQDASGSGQGYLYQFLIGLNLALSKSREAEEYSINIENFDDISFVDASGDPKELIQTKHKSQPKNLTDSSIDLWKTISIWIERDKGTSQDNLYFLVTNTKASPGSACEYLSQSRDKRNSDKALEKLLKTAAESEDKSTTYFRNTFLMSSETKRKNLLSRIYVIDSSPSIDELQSRLESEFLLAVKQDHRAPVSERIQSWWLTKVIELLKDSQKNLPVKVIALKLQDICYEFHNENLPIDFSDHQPEHGDALWGNKIFVRQLKLVTDQSERIKDAIVDYYRAYHQRLRWAREELVLDDDVDKYEKKLIEEWRRYKNAKADEFGSGDDERRKCGTHIYNWMETTANIPIRKYVSEPYVMRGSYHMLADEQRIGWHPDFLEKLKDILVKP